MNVLVAGGAGYIGSHTVKRLKEAGHAPVIYDNLFRGHREAIDILKVPAVVADLNDRPRSSPPCANTRSTRSCTSRHTPMSAKASISR